MNHFAFKLGVVALAVLSTGCATQAPPFDYSKFIQAKPKSLLVLPPLNDAPDIKATPSVWAHSTLPLSEAGYYVLPATLVDETFRQNGLDLAAQVHEVSRDKLRDFFGADAVVYLRVKQFGTTYAVISSETKVVVEGKVVDLRTGDLLWEGQAMATSAEQQQSSSGGLVGLLAQALVKQILGTVTDAAHNYAGVATQRLLGAPRPNGVLSGPRSPLYGQPPLTTAPR